jgi:hypothetical protein
VIAPPSVNGGRMEEASKRVSEFVGTFPLSKRECARRL